MPIYRNKKSLLSKVNPSSKSIEQKIDNSNNRLWNPSKNYQLCSKIISNRNANSGNIFTFHNSIFLMDGNKRFTTTGRHAAVSLIGTMNHTDLISAQPNLIVNNPKLDLDEYFIDAVQGYQNMMAVTSKGRVYSGGLNSAGGLGHGDTTSRYSLRRIETGNLTFGPGGIKAVKCFSTGAPGGTTQTFYLIDSEGKVYGSGANSNGELADGTVTNRNSFQRIGTLEQIVEIFTNGTSAFCLRSDGVLFAFGYNNRGQLGIGNTTSPITTPTQSFTNVKKVVPTSQPALGTTECSYLLRNDGTVWFTGDSGTTGNNGLGDSTDRSSWTRITTNISDKNIVDIIAGGAGGVDASPSRSAWFLADTGEVFATGYNGYGQLGDGTATNRTTPVSMIIPSNFPIINKILTFGGASEYGFMGINMESGRMITVGNYCSGCIGTSTLNPSATWPLEDPIANRAHYPAREVDPPPPVKDNYAKLKDVVQMLSDNTHTARIFALLDDGTVWAKGYGFYGEMGIRHVSVLGTSNQTSWRSSQFNQVWRQVIF